MLRAKTICLDDCMCAFAIFSVSIEPTTTCLARHRHTRTHGTHRRPATKKKPLHHIAFSGNRDRWPHINHIPEYEFYHQVVAQRHLIRIKEKKKKKNRAQTHTTMTMYGQLDDKWRWRLWGTVSRWVSQTWILLSHTSLSGRHTCSADWIENHFTAPQHSNIEWPNTNKSRHEPDNNLYLKCEHLNSSTM